MLKWRFREHVVAGRSYLQFLPVGGAEQLSVAKNQSVGGNFVDEERGCSNARVVGNGGPGMEDVWVANLPWRVRASAIADLRRSR